ncbi:peroxidase [Salix suchowensis]|nr:peroxidase [Salix suchowensis]
MAADSYSLCLLRPMDRLWFQNIILLSEPTAASKPLEQPQLMTTASSASTPPNKEILSSTSVPMLDSVGGSCSNEEGEEDDKDINRKERPTRLNLKTSRARSHSSTPSTQKLPKNIGRSGSLAILPQSMSCRSPGESKEYLNPRMMCIVPGLQRLGLCKNKQNTNLRDSEVAEDHDGLTREEEEEELKGAIRPPNSPLLNLRVPRISAATDMKKQLMFWARTVASEIQQEY